MLTRSARAGTARGSTASARAAEPVAVGTLLKQRYLLTQLLTEGGTSQIYLARDLLGCELHATGTDLAIKITRGAGVRSQRMSEAIAFHEAFIARRFAHPNIVRVYDFDRDNGICFVTMEFIDGESLAQRLQRSPNNRLAVREALRITRDVAAALEAVHAQGFIHSDIKPANILLSTVGGAKLIDFATARPNSSAGTAAAEDVCRYAGHSPAYASWETLQELPARPADDVYSLACVTYEMLTGTHPYGRLTAVEASARNIRPARPPGLNRRAWNTLRRALTPRATGRVQSVRELATALTPRPRRAAWTVLGLTLAASALAAGPGYTLWHDFNEERRASLTLRQQIDVTESLIVEISRATALERPLLLERARELPPLLRHAVLGAVGADTAAAIARQVQLELAAGNNPEEHAVFRHRVELLKKHLPDSHHLNEADVLLDKLGY